MNQHALCQAAVVTTKRVALQSRDRFRLDPVRGSPISSPGAFYCRRKNNFVNLNCTTPFKLWSKRYPVAIDVKGSSTSSRSSLDLSAAALAVIRHRCELERTVDRVVRWH